MQILKSYISFFSQVFQYFEHFSILTYNMASETLKSLTLDVLTYIMDDPVNRLISS